MWKKNSHWLIGCDEQSDGRIVIGQSAMAAAHSERSKVKSVVCDVTSVRMLTTVAMVHAVLMLTTIPLTEIQTHHSQVNVKTVLFGAFPAI